MAVLPPVSPDLAEMPQVLMDLVKAPHSTAGAALPDLLLSLESGS